LAAPETTTYEYDAQNRLTTVVYPGDRRIDYHYSAAGNRLSEVGTDSDGAALDRAFRYNRLNELVDVENRAEPAASEAYEYDGNGNTLRRATGPLGGTPLAVQSYLFDVRDRLVGVHTPAAGDLRFDYDYANRRTSFVSPQIDMRFLYDARGVLQEYAGATGVTSAKYVFGPTSLVSLVSPDAVRRPTYFYLTDGLFSTTELTDESGATRASYSYKAWGGLRRAFDQTANRRRFTGHYDDPETGLQYFNARFYDPTIGRFLTADSYGGDATIPSSRHRYAYAHNAPTNYVDPTGHYIESAIDIASLAAGSASFYMNMQDGDYAAASLDALGIVLDAVALALPGIPGGAGLGIKAFRAYKAGNTSRRIFNMFQFGERALNVGIAGGEAYLMYKDERYGWATVNGLFAMIGTAGAGSSAKRLINGTVAEGGTKLTRAPDWEPTLTGQSRGRYALSPTDYDLIRHDDRIKLLARKQLPSSLMDFHDSMELYGLVDDVGRRGLKVGSEGPWIRDLEIGVRATDPLTAQRSAGLSKLGVESKGMDIKSKSDFGSLTDASGKGLRTDYDIAWMIDRTDPRRPRHLSNDEAMVVVEYLNGRQRRRSGAMRQRLEKAGYQADPSNPNKMTRGATEYQPADATYLPTVNYNHGPHFSAFEHSSMQKWTKGDDGILRMTPDWAAYNRLGEPGAVEVFRGWSAAGKVQVKKEMLTAGQAYEHAIANNLFYPPTWKMSFAPANNVFKGLTPGWWAGKMAPLERVVGSK
jgi:RHS repeat-associated protein